MSALRPASSPADIDYVLGLQARPEFLGMIDPDGREVLEAAIADPDRRLLLWERDGAPQGFVFLVAQPAHARVEIRRMMLDAPGQGEGIAFLDSIVDAAFEDPACARLYLDVAADNPRAIRAYAQAGFVSEGRLREHWIRASASGPQRADLVLMGMLRREWIALRGAEQG